ncbi:uncharacterized protein LOC125223231 isoform X2 [Salvia hispanica]|uniref:uncharacterized protein LOC125223231 isoform X2 n=1 Tax=Salvia hispanica TaxID=49212 RepID=UPI00200995A2|nr:uncharacterized protein LOC125223231 isoform X2 [Salvia hispanica]
MNSAPRHTLHPGPIDDSVLTLQDHHRSTEIWNGQNFEPLTCRRCDGHFWRLGALDPRVQEMMLKAGFYGVYKAGRMRLDHALITALVERWRPETHTFHLPVGETTVTLQDISVLWGLPIDGEPITGVDTNRSLDEWQEICNELLGFRPPPEDFDRGRLKIRCLQERFKTLPDGASECTVQFYARAYILQLLGGQLLSDMSNNKVKLMYLPLLRDFEVAGKLSWGGAVLSCLYRALCRAAKPETSDICGPLVLLQIWAWERLPFIRPGRLTPREQPPPDVVAGDHSLPSAPYGSRWNVGFKLETVGTHVLVLYRDQLDNMKDDQFIWDPYPPEVLASLPEYCLSGRQIWQTVAPLICFDVVEFHHADRVLRQFGQQQSIPALCDTIPDIHLTDRRGRQNYDWAHHHRQFVDMWAERRARVICGPPIDGPMDQSDPYMMWYRRITRLLIGNPATRPNTGYQGVGGAMEAMAQSLQKIYHRASDAIHEGYEVSGEYVLREIQEICAYSLRAAHEDHRLTVRPDMGAASPSTAPFVPPKVQRGRPRKRGTLTSGRATDSRRRGSLVSSMFPTSSEVSHSFKPSNLFQGNVSDVPDTPGTWDSGLSAPDFQEDTDPNITQLDPEATETTNPMVQALEKIRDICACALGVSNQNQAMLSTHDMIPDGPKMKHCKPRRKGEMSGYLPHDSTGRDVEPLATPMSRESLLPELHDNLHLEMIEIDTLTGSREASPSPADPSMLNLHCDPPGGQDSALTLTDVKTDFSPGNDEQIQTGSAADDREQEVTGQEYRGIGDEVLQPVPEPPALEPCSQNSEQLHHVDTTTFNGTLFPHEDDPSASMVSTHNPEVSTLHHEPIEEAMHVNGVDNKSIPEPPVHEPQEAENPPLSDSMSHGMEDIKPYAHLAEKNIPEPSPAHQDSCGETIKVDEVDGDALECGLAKRKGVDADNADTTSSGPTVNSPCPDNSPFKPSPEGELQVTENDSAAAKDNVQRKYKRQRRSAPKQG